MNKKMLNQLRDESKRVTPDLKDNILSNLSINTTVPATPAKKHSTFKRSMLAFAPICIVIIILSIALPLGLAPAPTTPDIALLAFDVNPKFELKINDGKVSDVKSLNADAVVFFTDVHIIGQNLDVAINIIIDSLLADGYLTKNTVNILTTSSTQKIENKYLDLTEKLLSDITKNKHFNYNIYKNQNLKKQAKKYKTTNNKLYLANMVAEKNNLSLDSALKMSTEELTRILCDYSQDTQDFDQNYKQALEKLEQDYKIKQDALDIKAERIDDILDEVDDGADYKTYYDEIKSMFPQFDASDIRNRNQFCNKVEATIKQAENKLEASYRQGLKELKIQISDKLNNGENIDYDKDFNIDYEDDDTDDDTDDDADDGANDTDGDTDDDTDSD